MQFRIFLMFAALWLCFHTSANAQLKWKSLTEFTHATPDEGHAFAHFSFTNSGDRPVKITSLRTTCGCTAAVSEKRLFAPGEEGEVTVSFKTVNRNGLYEEPITVRTDDPNASEAVLKLRVLIRDLLTVEPTFVFWKKGEPLTPKNIHVKITDGFSVKQLEVSSTNADVALHVDTIKAGSEYNVVVKPNTGHIKAKLSVTPDYPNTTKVFTAYVRAD